MKILRNLINIPFIFRQYSRETSISEFDLNKIIKWLGNRQYVEIDDDLLS